MNERIQTPKETIRPNQEQSETLSQSLTQRVKEALEKIRSRVKAYVEKGKVKQNLTEGRYEEIYEMIEEYPEDIRERVGERVDQELMSNPDILVSRFPDKALAESDKFLYSTDEKGEKKLEKEKARKILEALIKKGDISNIVKNLDLVIQVGLFENIKDLVLSSDENIIQEALKTASPEVRKVYEDKFEKVYLKKEYIDKAIVGTREKGEKAETEEEKEKYRRVVEGLEYLRDYEKNVREHCKKMFEQHGIFEDSTVNYLLETIDLYLKNERTLLLLNRIAQEENLSVIEVLGYIQSQTNELVRSYTIYSKRKYDEVKHILTGNGDAFKIEGHSEQYRRFFSLSERRELEKEGIVFPIPLSTGQSKDGTKILYEKFQFGKEFAAKEHGSKNITYGFLGMGELVQDQFLFKYDNRYGNLLLELKDSVRDRATFSITQTDSSRIANINRGIITSWVRFPHVASVLETQFYHFQQIRDTRINLDRDFKRNLDSENDMHQLEIQFHGETGSADQIQTIMYHHERPQEGEMLRQWVAECDIPNDIQIESDKERHHSRKRN